MQTRKRWLITSLAAMLIVASGAVAAFGGWNGHHGHGFTHDVYRLTNLTAQQKTGIQKVIDASHDAAYARMKNWRDDRRALYKALETGAALATIRPLAEKAGQQLTATIMARAETRAKIDAILTPKQRQQLEKLEPRHGACDHHDGDHGHWHGDSHH